MNCSNPFRVNNPTTITQINKISNYSTYKPIYNNPFEILVRKKAKNDEHIPSPVNKDTVHIKKQKRMSILKFSGLRSRTRHKEKTNEPNIKTKETFKIDLDFVLLKDLEVELKRSQIDEKKLDEIKNKTNNTNFEYYYSNNVQANSAMFKELCSELTNSSRSGYLYISVCKGSKLLLVNKKYFNKNNKLLLIKPSSNNKVEIVSSLSTIQNIMQSELNDNALEVISSFPVNNMVYKKTKMQITTDNSDNYKILLEGITTYKLKEFLSKNILNKFNVALLNVDYLFSEFSNVTKNTILGYIN